MDFLVSIPLKKQTTKLTAKLKKHYSVHAVQTRRESNSFYTTVVHMESPNTAGQRARRLLRVSNPHAVNNAEVQLSIATIVR